jgi:hypothetical protein
VGFNHTTLAQQADRAVRMLLMAVARTWGQAHDRVRRRVSTGPSDHTALIEELCREAQNDALMSTSTLSVTRFQQGRESQQCLEARYLRRSRRQLPSQTARGDAGRRRPAEPIGEPGDGLEHDEDAVGARPLERPTFDRCAAAADWAHRPDAYGGHQLAGRVHLPDRAIPGPATTVTSGSKITRFWRLNGSSDRRQTLLTQRTEWPLYSTGYRRARHFSPCFREQSTGTFGTEIKGTPVSLQSAMRRALPKMSMRAKSRRQTKAFDAYASEIESAPKGDPSLRKMQVREPQDLGPAKHQLRDLADKAQKMFDAQLVIFQRDT